MKNLAKKLLRKIRGCPFCKWKALKHEVFYETQSFICVYNIRPVFEGHALIIPKRHKESLLKMSEYEIEELPSVIKLAMVVLKKAYKAQGFNVVLQEGMAAGATIKHLHFHVLPRHKGDIPPHTEWEEYFHQHESKRRMLTKEEIAKEVRKITKLLP